MLSNQRQQEQDDERLKKRFGEIEERIREALQEREDAERSLQEYRQLLIEAQESCEHAEQGIA